MPLLCRRHFSFAVTYIRQFLFQPLLRYTRSSCSSLKLHELMLDYRETVDGCLCVHLYLLRIGVRTCMYGKQQYSVSETKRICVCFWCIARWWCLSICIFRVAFVFVCQVVFVFGVICQRIPRSYDELSTKLRVSKNTQKQQREDSVYLCVQNIENAAFIAS